MTPEQFVYWLQGFNEIRDIEAVGLSENEWEIIREHLKTVFHKVTPDRTPDFVPNVLPQQPYLYYPYNTGTPPNLVNPRVHPIITC